MGIYWVVMICFVYRLFICPQLFQNHLDFPYTSYSQPILNQFHNACKPMIPLRIMHRMWLCICTSRLHRRAMHTYVRLCRAALVWGRAWATRGYGASCIHHSPQKWFFSSVNHYTILALPNLQCLHNLSHTIGYTVTKQQRQNSDICLHNLCLLQNLQVVTVVTVVTMCNNYTNRHWLLSVFV